MGVLIAQACTSSLHRSEVTSGFSPSSCHILPARVTPSRNCKCYRCASESVNQTIIEARKRRVRRIRELVNQRHHEVSGCHGTGSGSGRSEVRNEASSGCGGVVLWLVVMMSVPSSRLFRLNSIVLMALSEVWPTAVSVKSVWLGRKSIRTILARFERPHFHQRPDCRKTGVCGGGSLSSLAVAQSQTASGVPNANLSFWVQGCARVHPRQTAIVYYTESPLLDKALAEDKDSEYKPLKKHSPPKAATTRARRPRAARAPEFTRKGLRKHCTDQAQRQNMLMKSR